ncbi:hypothetical protein [Pontibacter arcticus]|uniref:hypothetical protein n=1 Tax=Pontibacter arcticus TaxID=2080288 RepID=UPI000F618533|nr:hypothetical protein [Pontibacter arcticus]
MLLTLCTACDVRNEVKKSISVEYSTLDSTIAVIPYDTAYYWIFKDAEAAHLTKDDFENIELVLNGCIKKYNSKYDSVANRLKIDYPWYKLKKEKYFIELKNYKRQYVAVTNSNGQKVVWANFFCHSFHDNWRESIVMFSDGGNCYFKLKINLATKECYELRVNGEA